MFSFDKYFLLTLVICQLQPAAFAGTYEVEFGPYVGNGTSSDQADVRYVSGFRANVSRQIFQSSVLNLSPVALIENSFFNTRSTSEGSITIADYDHRTFGLGFEVSSPATFQHKPFDVFLRSTVARSYTKVGVDQSTGGTTFTQKLINGIRGIQNTIELGASIPLQPDFYVGLSALGTINQLEQFDATASQETEENGPGGLTLTSGALARGQTGLPNSVVQKSIGASITASVLF